MCCYSYRFPSRCQTGIWWSLGSPTLINYIKKKKKSNHKEQVSSAGNLCPDKFITANICLLRVKSNDHTENTARQHQAKLTAAQKQSSSSTQPYQTERNIFRLRFSRLYCFILSQRATASAPAEPCKKTGCSQD